ncbi:hypothetical protein KFE25_006697 [Diacronema lutheri]|uniref:GHMP kinase C-terminal domain-containing protein n=2 Tax=Diacronema lutheri TaxID=2081491 RepID=A0A8J6CF53_DIALT|nr:hypothetical protein KFE25_006697 [Diacronema lutheri]
MADTRGGAACDDDLRAFPWRICLAGGWLDQPWVSQLHAGPVIVVNVRPHPAFKTRSGLATSTRALGIELWGTRAGGTPPRDVTPERLARLLFNVENPVGCAYVSGSQDALGLMLPGVNRLDYAGGFWPERIERVESEASVAWLERVLRLVPMPARPAGYDPLVRKNLSADGVRRLAAASEQAWTAIRTRDAPMLGAALTRTMAAWRELLPETVPTGSDELVAPYAQRHHGCLFSGAGGGFLLVVTEEADEVACGFAVEITREHPHKELRREQRAPWQELGQVQAQPPQQPQMTPSRTAGAMQLHAEAGGGGPGGAQDQEQLSGHAALSDNLGRLLTALCVGMQLFVVASRCRWAWFGAFWPSPHAD